MRYFVTSDRLRALPNFDIVCVYRELMVRDLNVIVLLKDPWLCVTESQTSQSGNVDKAIFNKEHRSPYA